MGRFTDWLMFGGIHTDLLTRPVEGFLLRVLIVGRKAPYRCGLVTEFSDAGEFNLVTLDRDHLEALRALLVRAFDGSALAPGTEIALTRSERFVRFFPWHEDQGIRPGQELVGRVDGRRWSVTVLRPGVGDEGRDPGIPRPWGPRDGVPTHAVIWLRCPFSRLSFALTGAEATYLYEALDRAQSYDLGP
jgi:hypothetical protein